MSKLREAARRALTALNIFHGAVTDTDWKMDFQPEIDALRDALAEDRLNEGEPCPCTRCDHSCEDRRNGKEMGEDYLGMMDGAPVFQVNKNGEFWCLPGCGKKHKHEGEGHRKAHCNRKNPNAWDSYYIARGQE